MLQHELLAPGICIICEGSAPGLVYFDTNYNLTLDTIIHLSGRKYVCETCASQIADYWGYESSNQIEEALAFKERVKSQLKDLYTSLDTGRDIVMRTWHDVENQPVKVRARVHDKVKLDGE